MQQIVRFEVVQTAKVVAILYLVLAAMFCVPIAIFSIATHTNVGHSSGFVFLLVPFVYAVIGFGGVALACLVYNWVAKNTGGIAFQIENRSETPT